MKVYTSYFGNLRNIPEGVEQISIARNAAAWFNGKVLYQTTIPKREYNGEHRISNINFENRRGQVIILTEKPVNKYSIKLLAPMSKAFGDYLETRDEEKFKKAYREEVLDRLDQHRILSYFKGDVCFICHEVPGDVCHRHYGADWFGEAGVEVTELCGKK